MMKNDAKHIGWKGAAALTALWLVAFAIARANMWINDDADYQVCYGWDGYKPFTAWWQVFYSQAYHYLHLNGRYVVHCIVQWFCGFWGKWAFDAANAAVMCGCVCVMMRLAGARLAHSTTLLGMILLVLGTFLVPYAPSYMVSYLWTVAAALWWLWEWQKPRNASPWGIAMMFLLSVLIGNGQEVISPGVLAGSALFALMHRRQTTARQWWMLAGYAIGTIVIFCSPATFARFTSNALHTHSSLPLINIVRYHIILWLLIACVLWLKWRKGVELRIIYRDNALWINILVMLFLAQAVVGVQFHRQVIGTETVAAVLLLRLMPQRQFCRALVAAFALAVAVMMCFMVRYLSYSNGLVRDMQSQLVHSDTVYCDIDDVYDGPCINHPVCPYTIMAWNIVREANGEKKMTWMPKALKGKDLKNPQNEVIRMSNGAWLVVINRHRPPTRCVSTWVRDWRIYRWPPSDYEFNPQHLSDKVVDTHDCLAAIIYDNTFYNLCISVRLE